ncbi:VRR-NUC domain-containing protein [Facklamia sp. P12945]|uniref:VRR-NUC domain-containing protein n=1 Tax=unclassified Facklamia TaxID=2622293 RepID=UPI003D180205
MKEEKKVENSIKRYLDSLGAYHLKIHGSAYMPAGTPDILACVKGRFVAIEVKKAKGGVVSALQKLKIKQINQAGGIAFVANSLEVVKNELSRHDLI